MTDDIDIGQISEALNDKVDLDSSWSQLTKTYDDLTLGASDSSYTAPADGYIIFNKTSTSATKFIAGIVMKDENDGLFNVRSNIPNAGGNAGILFPVRRGDTFKILYNADGTTNYFRFIYAQKTN